MKSYEEIITLSARFDWMVRSKHPNSYMPAVFGITPDEDPALKELLLAASHCGGLCRLLETLSKKHTDCIMHYISRKMKRYEQA